MRNGDLKGLLKDAYVVSCAPDVYAERVRKKLHGKFSGVVRAGWF